MRWSAWEREATHKPTWLQRWNCWQANSWYPRQLTPEESTTAFVCFVSLTRHFQLLSLAPTLVFSIHRHLLFIAEDTTFGTHLFLSFSSLYFNTPNITINANVSLSPLPEMPLIISYIDTLLMGLAQTICHSWEPTHNLGRLSTQSISNCNGHLMTSTDKKFSKIQNCCSTWGFWAIIRTTV